MDLPNQDDFAQMARQIREIKALSEQQVITSKLGSDISFATIAFCCEVDGELRENREISYNRKMESTEWEGINEEQVLVGYLSHNKTNLRFETRDAVIFDVPFNELQQTEPHALGLLITVKGKQYIVGNFTEVNEQLSPKSKLSYNFGSEAIIWMRELGGLGVVDLAAYEKSRSKGKVTMMLFYAAVIAVTVIFFLAR